MPGVFVDTGGWIALAVEDDHFHTTASRYLREVRASRRQLWTTNYVLAETYTRIRYDAGHHRAVAFHGVIVEAINRSGLDVEWITPQLHEEAWRTFRDYADQRFSIVDCTSFVGARQVGVDEVFGFDSGFLTMGFSLKPGL